MVSVEAKLTGLPGFYGLPLKARGMLGYPHFKEQGHRR